MRNARVQWIRSFILLMLVLFLCSSCVTPGALKPVGEGLPRPGAKVMVGTVTNVGVGTSELHIEQKLLDELRQALQEENILGGGTGAPADFRLDLRITRYEPGNAFKRWLIPGYGSTVLELEGELTDSKDGSRVALIKQERTVAVGGLYTIGAWSTIVGQAARDIARELKTRIEKGGDFVVVAEPRSERGTAIQPMAVPLQVAVEPTDDQRQEQGRIGERFAAFGVKMGDVYTNRRVSDYFREAVIDEIQLMGNRVVETGEDVRITPTLTKFWVTTETTPLYWDIVSEVECRINFTCTRPGCTPAERRYAARKSDRTYIWPSATIMTKVLNESIDAVFDQMRSDGIWETFVPGTGAQPR